MLKNKNYQHNINKFRAIAIVFVVLSHCFDLGFCNLNEDTTFFGRVIKILLPGATTFFVFISGYLFSHIYSKNFNYKRFMIGKIRNVLFPFLFISSIIPFLYLIRIFYGFIVQSNYTSIYIVKFVNYPFFETYILGHSSITGLWYVPFIIVLFSLSPLYLKFFSVNNRLQLVAIFFLLILSMLLHRAQTSHLITIFQNVLYFTPVYLLGFLASTNCEILYSKINGKAYALLILIFVFLSFQINTATTEQIKDFNNISLVNFDFMIIQKLLFCFFFIIYLNKFISKENVFLSLLAENSFGIYFIHGLYIKVFRTITVKFSILFTTTSMLVFFFSATLILVISLVTSILIRKVLPNKSRYFIGC